MSMRFARSRPPMTPFPHSLRALLSLLIKGSSDSLTRSCNAARAIRVIAES
jgi:hypothetical protein